VLFEYSRVSDSTLEWILENLVPNKLTSGFDNIWIRIVTSLAQILPHCTWREWKRILKLCRHLIQRSILQVLILVLYVTDYLLTGLSFKVNSFIVGSAERNFAERVSKLSVSCKG